MFAIDWHQIYQYPDFSTTCGASMGYARENSREMCGNKVSSNVLFDALAGTDLAKLHN